MYIKGKSVFCLVDTLKDGGLTSDGQERFNRKKKDQAVDSII